MQEILPLKPQGATPINEQVCVIAENGKWVYYVSMCPVYSHAEEDREDVEGITDVVPRRLRDLGEQSRDLHALGQHPV